MSPERLAPLRPWFLGVAPLAAVIALVLFALRPAPPGLRLEKDRASFISAARTVAAERGVALGTALPRLVFESERRVPERLQHATATESEALLRWLTPLRVRVRLPEAGNQQRFQADFNVYAHEVGAAVSRGQQPQAGPGAADAEAKAWAMARGLRLDEFKRDDDGDEDRSLAAKATPVSGGDPGLRVAATIQNGHVREISLRLAEARSSRDAWPESLRRFLSGAGIFLTIAFSIYALHLVRIRRREGELPWPRIRLLVALLALTGALSSLGSIDGIQFTSEDIPVWVARGVGTLVMALGYALLGVLLAAGFGAAEGEIREAWPGKLLSFDALLAGHVRSVPVAGSLAVGAAAAAWGVFFAALAYAALPLSSAAMVDRDLYGYWLAAYPVIALPTTLALKLIFVIVAGFWMPLTWVRRRRWEGWKKWLALVAPALCLTLAQFDYSLSTPAAALARAAALMVLIGPFFACDVLASAAGLLVFEALYRAGLTLAYAPAAAGAGWVLGVGIIALAMTLVILGRRGAAVKESEVRPAYVQRIEQRLSLQAEASSARQAQLRLLPDTPPRAPGLDCAALCHPAREVGGDFYDYFPQPDGRIAFLVASGGGLGLASALTIALAKGFVASDLKRNDGPQACLERLRALLTDRATAAAGVTGLALGLFDSAKGELDWAKQGEFPSAWITDHQGQPASLSPGTVCLKPGDVIVMHSRGLSDLLEDQSPSGVQKWVGRQVKRSMPQGAAAVVETIAAQAGGRKGKRLRRLRYDLTVLALRWTPEVRW